jgi:Holliday junction resolvase RusA-like endonuclease
MDTVRFTVPLTPPSVNDYVRHTRRGRHYQTQEAIAFKDAVALCAGGQQIDAQRLAVAITVYLGKADKGDIDNFPKLVLDGLKRSVVTSDAKFKRMVVDLDRDWLNPRTEIEVSALPHLPRKRRP